jgi:hypothetical protein
VPGRPQGVDCGESKNQMKTTCLLIVLAAILSGCASQEKYFIYPVAPTNSVSSLN